MKSTNNFQLSRPNTEYNANQKAGICEACGAYTTYEYKPIINSILAKQWRLNKTERELWSARESMYCAFCGCTYRLRMLASAISVAAGNNTKSLKQLICDGLFEGKKVAEINSCGVLHDILKDIPNIDYSEYESQDEKIPHQDLLNLTYKDSTFDYIFTSDVLEHVPDPKKALTEVYRVLKPGGRYIMSVPLIMNRKTKNRTHLQDQKTMYDSPPSFHGSGEPDYLVWNEFGFDFIDAVRESGFAAYYLFVNEKKLEDPTGIIICYKTSEKIALASLASSGQGIKNIDLEWQAERVQSLRDKLKLTQKHADNLQSINEGYEKERVELNKVIKQLMNEISLIKSSVIWKATQKVKKISRIN